MLVQFQKHLSINFPFLKGKKLLLAISGGLDSMVLLHLFKQFDYDYDIIVLHCNFQLRGLESIGDKNFIQEYTMQNNIPFLFKQFDTEVFASTNKLSIQLAARNLRYNWFYEQLEIQNAHFILTAHHADDNLETFLINFSRGTGLEGLTGIPAKNDKIIRPLLLFSRTDIEQYATQNNIVWREDTSNASDKYLRNKIRHHLVPILKDLNPNFLNSFEKTQRFLQESQDLVNDASSMFFKKIAKEVDDAIYFDLATLFQLPNYKAYLYQWLKDFGFTAWDDVYDLVQIQSGKQVLSHYFRLIKNRDYLILSPIQSNEPKQEFIIETIESKINIPLNITFSNVEVIESISSSTIFVDQDKLEFPLTLRHWKKGDYFLPLGMKGKSKKISKLFKDKKLSLIDKEKTWLLCSKNEVIWIIGIRQDERFKIEAKTKRIVKISIEQ